MIRCECPRWYTRMCVRARGDDVINRRYLSARLTKASRSLVVLIRGINIYPRRALSRSLVLAQC